MTTEFPPMKNDLLLRAARGEPTERAPVWVMRQAGRYLPEFRKVRESHEFFEVCRTPALATEVTAQPIRRYRGLLDGSIIFSDILVVPQALGMEVLMNPGPFFPEPLVTPSDVSKLRTEVDVNKELGYVFEAITQTRKELDGIVPLIGFCGAPWTLFSYMIEGGGSKTLQKAKTWLFKYPEESKALLKRIADVCVDFLVGQVKAGAQLLQVFDSWAGELSPYDFGVFTFPTLQHISRSVRQRLSDEGLPSVPLILFAKGANHALKQLAEEGGYDVLGIDWCIDPVEARCLVGPKITLQGNMDPNVLYGGRDAIEETVKRMSQAFRSSEGGWIANLGHGITPGVDPEDMRWFLECVHKYSSSTN
ncbi:uroporphyrinogen decarboxylase [Coprinopsis marcescibilis]|uniref:Uroporphyrinogen decarboxylase n=1 Tax=Coprinopsis marcescibilis TaxID=230819 RepID=A0A5C3L896_COPMA|nr:uroporphyrinogen decarboxylase [Coprinopsis marcescibilis]